MYLIAGLGNPTTKYEKTRHNVGFDVIDELSRRYGIDVNVKKHKALIGRGIIDGNRVMLIKPQTFMNNSGESIVEILDYYRLDAEEDLLVISDDISLAPGRIRIRKKGSAGGHNGLKDIIAWTDTEGFARVRIGVGEKPRDRDLVDHVLSRFSQEEREPVDRAIEEAADACAMIVNGDIDGAMNKYNGKG